MDTDENTSRREEVSKTQIGDGVYTKHDADRNNEEKYDIAYELKDSFSLRNAFEEPTDIIFCGNPGVGKSTLLSSVSGKQFESGLSFGRGYTSELKFELDVRDKNLRYADTPGLADIDMAEKAAAAISKALKSAVEKKRRVKIFFVVTDESGRIRPADHFTINKVIGSINLPQDIKTKVSLYGVIVNKCQWLASPDKIVKHGKETLRSIFALENETNEFKTYYVHFLPEIKGLINEFDGKHDFHGLNKFLKEFKGIETVESVEKIDVSNFRKQLEKQQQLHKQQMEILEKKIKEQNQELQDKLKEAREDHYRRIQAERKRLDKKLEDRQREIDRQRLEREKELRIEVEEQQKEAKARHEAELMAFKQRIHDEQTEKRKQWEKKLETEERERLALREKEAKIHARAVAMANQERDKLVAERKRREEFEKKQKEFDKKQKAFMDKQLAAKRAQIEFERKKLEEETKLKKKILDDKHEAQQKREKEFAAKKRREAKEHEDRVKRENEEASCSIL